MPTSNFLIFDQNKANMIGDEAYQTSTQRLNGVQSGVASSMLNNKFAYQVSLVAYAIAQIMNQNGIDATDTMAVSQFVNNLSSTFLQKVVDKASVEDAIAASSDSKWMSPKAVKGMLQHMGSGWQLLQKWEVAGTYSWTAPDLLGNGQPYEIGILLIGGGGSGGAVTNIYSTKVSGGSSGQARCFTREVSPGISYNLAVGKGGESVSAVSSDETAVYKNGINGGDSSFEDYIVVGGSGGTKYSGTPTGIKGSQLADHLGSSSPHIPKVAPFGGNNFVTYLSYDSSAQLDFSGRTIESPLTCLNLFEMKIILGAGGSVDSYDTAQTSSLDMNLKVAGGFASIGSQNESVIAGDAKQPGCGGGAALNRRQGKVNKYATSGAGADGGCYIYVSALIKN